MVALGEKKIREQNYICNINLILFLFSRKSDF